MKKSNNMMRLKLWPLLELKKQTTIFTNIITYTTINYNKKLLRLQFASISLERFSTVQNTSEQFRVFGTVEYNNTFSFPVYQT